MRSWKTWLSLMVLVLLVVPRGTQAQSDTGWKRDATTAVDTVFFSNADNADDRLKCDWIFINLSDLATGPVNIRRSRNRNFSVVKFIDATSILYVMPGEKMLLTGRDMNAFLYSKSAATDMLMWIAGTGEYAPSVSGGTGGVPDLIRTNVLSSTDLEEGASVDVELGDISAYWEVYVIISATGAQDSTQVYFGSSENLTWAAGNTAYFDYDPSTKIIDPKWLSSTYDTYGDCVPILNSFGAFLPGPYGLLRIINANALDKDIIGLTVDLILRK